MNSPISWVGGKRALKKRLVEMLPEPRTGFVEAFAGSAQVLFAKDPEPGEVINDVNRELVNFFTVLQHRWELFLLGCQWLLHSRALFDVMVKQDPQPLDDVSRAVRFYFLNKASFGAKMATYGPAPGDVPRLNPATVRRDCERWHRRLWRVQVECLDFRRLVAMYDRPGTVFFFDPPYYGSNHYGAPFGRRDYEDLAQLLRGIEGRAILTINDCKTTRAWFAGLPFEEVGVRYSLHQRSRGKRRELIVRNWEK